MFFCESLMPYDHDLPHHDRAVFCDVQVISPFRQVSGIHLAYPADSYRRFHDKHAVSLAGPRPAYLLKPFRKRVPASVSNSISVQDH